jgi:hypothetical protein
MVLHTTCRSVPESTASEAQQPILSTRCICLRAESTVVKLSDMEAEQCGRPDQMFVERAPPNVNVSFVTRKEAGVVGYGSGAS